jgi:hypothetical protein
VKGRTVQNPLRRRTRALTAEQYDEVQKLVFDLVRERLVESFGPTGMWTVSMKGIAEEHNIFNETVAESLAWSIAAELAPQKKAAAPQSEVSLPTEETPVDAPSALFDVDTSRAEQLVA